MLPRDRVASDTARSGRREDISTTSDLTDRPGNAAMLYAFRCGQRGGRGDLGDRFGKECIWKIKWEREISGNRVSLPTPCPTLEAGYDGATGEPPAE
ncbi:unnamed protein product [Protopolystoma xenopodis]|uniref:Uncharacterized protein n=1 Tax=Protopolystoma xenopodis TaxID=117903 RepID=A0A448WWB5_9PLAT|nr:unnamed protein product [Protopolystoma xenopodis]